MTIVPAKQEKPTIGKAPFERVIRIVGDADSRKIANGRLFRNKGCAGATRGGMGVANEVAAVIIPTGVAVMGS